jgi:glycosyltransferase involved in cell wall biosynthesis
MRLLFTGCAPWCNTGYAKPARYVLPRLVRLGHDVGLACFYGYQGATERVDVGGEEVLLFSAARDRWFNDIIPHHARSFKADAVITVQDVWTLQGWGEMEFAWLPWMPVDTSPVDRPTLDALRGCYAPMSYSQWGRDQLLETNWQTARYLPLGVDTEVFRIRNQAETRRATELPEDGLIVGMIAANASCPSRKCFPEVLLAWKRWKDEGGEGLLYLHTTIAPSRSEGIDFVKLLDTLSIPWSTLADRDEERRGNAWVLFPDQHRMWSRLYSEEDLAMIYSAFDVLMSPSMSEGFGLPILEAQACGVPVITLAFSSMPELTWIGECVQPVQLVWADRGGWRAVPRVSDILGGIEWAMEARTTGRVTGELSSFGRKKACAFDWDRIVAEYWVPLLEELDASIAH